MRRLLATLAVLVTLVACGGTEGLPRLSADDRPATGAVLRVADPSGISLLDTSAGRFDSWIRGGVRSRDWVFQSRLTAAGTQLVAVSPQGEVGWHRDLAGDLSTRVVSSDGTRVAMLPYRYASGDPYSPASRSITELTVVETDTGENRAYRLDGNFEPEAFAASGRGLFVIEYVPAINPDRYRVRELDLETGKVGAVYSVDGHLQESMRGTARVAALSADGTRLYTLYTTADDGHGTGPGAFVHVLDLEEEWAHCVDLPAPIGSSPEEHLAIAADPNGERVLVVDALAGIAEVDAVDLVTTRSIPWSAPTAESGLAVAAVDADGRLFAGRGNAITVFDRWFDEPETWLTPTRMIGLYVDPRGDRVWLLGQRAMHAIDAKGVVDETVPLPDEMPALDVPSAPTGSPIQCAC